MAGKVKRLSKVARELNVGISTIVEFLGTQSIEIESSPNTKIEPDVYEVLLSEFQADAAAKEKSQKVSVKKSVRETVSLKDKKEDEEGGEAVEETPAPETEEEVPPVVEEVKEEVKEEPVQPEPEEPKAEPVAEEVKEEVKEEPKVEVEPEPVVEEKIETKAEEPAKEEKEDKTSPKVLGKIDLSSINTKTRPDKRKKAEAKKEEPKKETPKKEAPKKEAPKKAEPKVEAAPAKEEKAAEAPKPVETIKAKTEKLSGPTVVGKIELPVEKPKKPKGSSNKDDDKPKRKRKRIKKVNIDKQAKTSDRNFKKKKPTEEKQAVSQEEIQKEIKDTLARLNKSGKSKSVKNRRAKRDAVAAKMEEERAKAQEEQRVLKLTEFVTVSELASLMNLSVTDIISACMSIGIFASINQRLDKDTIEMISEEYGYEVNFVSAEEESEEEVEEVEDESLLEERPPVVTVMGHVDHGKTSLLDYIRKADVTAGEAGGITQHIGAYSVTMESGKKITFLDTPGHEAFTAMRARGAQVTDVAIIIIAADDSVMPQTKEAINHAQAAGVPMVFAINKVDKPGANPDKIREALSTMNILVEDWGGKYQCQEISAKSGLGIEELLEKVTLEAELLELKANPNKPAVGTVIESSLDVGRGYVTTLLVQAGTLKIGDAFVAGPLFGKVKAMTNERGQRVEEAGPSTPVSMLGLSGAPNAGDRFRAMEDEKEAKSLANKRQQLQREQGLRAQKHITLDEIGRRIAVGDFQEVNVIIKGDVDGSVEALSDSLQKLSTESIQVNVVHKGVGQITESDVNLAAASDALIVGFQVRPSAGARKIAETEGIDIRLYSIIYQAIDDLKEAMEGMLSPELKEEIIGSAEVRETFKISKVGTIAGCFVLDGMLKRNAGTRVIRDGVVIYTGELGSLKRFKDDVKEVKRGYECGLNVEGYNDVQVGDVIEAYEEVEVQRKL